MEEEVLLDMYRSSWNEFLEAYKVKMNQNEALIKLNYELIEKELSSKKKAIEYKTKLGNILEV